MDARPFGLLVLAAASAISLTSCTGSAGDEQPRSGRYVPSAPASSPAAAASSRAPQPARLTGKFTASPLVFLDARTGLLTIGGFAGNSARVSSWQERTTDGGRTWTAGPVAHTGDGRYPMPVASTQVGLAFKSGAAGWAYQPSLFFTRDGGGTWQREPGAPPAVGPVAVHGSSTWIVGYPCRSFHCRPRLFSTDRVGGPLTPLPSQPARSDAVDRLLRPGPRTAWVVVEDARGGQRLIATRDGGRTWQARSVPCGPRDRFDVSGDRPTALYLMCAAPSLSMCSSCGARVLYRSADDGAEWTRITPSPTPAYGPTTPAQFVQPVGASALWAVSTSQIGTGSVLRSADRGRTWQRVLRPLAVESFFAADPARAWLVAVSSTPAKGVRFTVYRTTDGGSHWHTTLLPVPTTLR
jgi:photosystem II stability/assembly factor-like uncharacterized protein